MPALFVVKPASGSCGGPRAPGVFAALLLLAGCAYSLRRPGNTAANKTGAAGADAAAQVSAGNTPSAERLGIVHVIGTGQRFVLVQTPSMLPVSALTDGQALVCRGGGSVTATLRVSHERRPPFVVADVAAGEPRIGDEVFIDTVPGRTKVPDAQGPLPTTPPGASPPVGAPDFRADPVLPPTR